MRYIRFGAKLFRSTCLSNFSVLGAHAQYRAQIYETDSEKGRDEMSIFTEKLDISEKKKKKLFQSTDQQINTL